MLNKFLKENTLVFIFLACCITLELSAQYFVGAALYFTRFWITLLLLFVFLGILFAFKSIKIKSAISLLFLTAQICILLGTNFLYNATGTVFQKEMIYQRNDAFGTMEQFNVSSGLVAICVFVSVFYIAVLAFFVKKYRRRLHSTQSYIDYQSTLEISPKTKKGLFRSKPAATTQVGLATDDKAYQASPISDGDTYKPESDTAKSKSSESKNKHTKAQLKTARKAALKSAKKEVAQFYYPSQKRIRIWSLALALICLGCFCTAPVIDGISERNKSDYYHKLVHTADGTQKYGSTANIFYELLEFIASTGINTDNLDKLEDFLYEKKAPHSPYFGVSEGNNVAMILVESFDTHVLEKYSKEETALLFPNITRLMDEGVNATNFRQKEKTDSSEVMSLLSTYPTDKYVNYGYEKNAYPFSLPNLFRQKAEDLGTDPQLYSFHHSSAWYYNRDTLHPSFGFDRLFGIDDMLEYGMVNTWDPSGGVIKKERSLDSHAMRAMKDEMFTADKNFFSYWITFSMHGFYEERENLKAEGYYDRMDELGLFPKGNKNENYHRTYAAAVMDFDKAVGIMMDELETKGLLEDTTIVMFSDHNTYYNNLTAYAKNITNPQDVEGFRIPMFIYDQKLSAAIDAAGKERTIQKFTTTSDLLPTICDLLGIEIWENFYLGNSIFREDVESIVYSKMYNFFFNDKMAFFTMHDLKYTSDDYTIEHLNDFVDRAKIHLDKLYYIDQVFYTDYFAHNTYRRPI